MNGPAPIDEVIMKVSSDKDARGARVLELEGLVKAPIRQVWDIVSDTQRLNQVVFDLPPVNVVERGASHIEAEMRVGGIDLVFDEHPWEYDAPHRFRSLRAFKKGPLERLESSCELEDVAGTTTRVRFRLAIAAKSGPVGWAAEKIFTAQAERGLEKLAALLEGEQGARPASWVNPERDAVRARAAPLAHSLAQALAGQPAGALVDRLVDRVASAPDDVVTRIRPYALAEDWGVAREDALALCLHAVHVGLLQMRWDTLCPSCKGPLASHETLSAVNAQEKCVACDVVVDVSRTSNVEAAFAPAAGVRVARPSMFCLGSPRHTPHWLAQLVLEPGEVRVTQPVLGAGRYVLQSPGIPVRTLIDVGETGDDHVRITLEGTRGGRPPTLPAATPLVHAGRVKLTLKNEDERARRVQLVNEGFANLSATAAHVTETSTWRALFGAVAA